MLFNIVLVLHLLVCVLLTIVVLMQSGRGGSISAAFGGSGGTGGQIFGGRETATFLSKMTTYLAIAFFLTSLGLAFLSGMRGGKTESSALRRAAREQAGTIAPEEQKNVNEVIGNVSQPEEGQQGQAPAQQTQQPAPAGQGGK